MTKIDTAIIIGMAIITGINIGITAIHTVIAPFNAFAACCSFSVGMFFALQGDAS